eukprot:6609655-Pyramimonas_sp.AAC.2
MLYIIFVRELLKGYSRVVWSSVDAKLASEPRLKVKNTNWRPQGVLYTVHEGHKRPKGRGVE